MKASLIGSLRYPSSSVRQIPGVWEKITFSIMGQDLTLDHIEHEILRKEFNEPRIHMALVCAALSCPFLNQEPYEGARLDQQLDDQDSNFLSSGSYRVRYLDYDWTLNDRIYQ